MFYRNQSIITPDGFSGRVLLCAGRGVTVWLTNANWLPMAERYRWYDKQEFVSR